jgi:prolycopene isomerase
MAASPAVDYLKEVLPRLEFKKVPEAYRVILTEKNVDFRAPYDPETFTRAVIKAVGGSEKPIRDFMAVCAETFNAFNYLGEHPRPSLKVLTQNFPNFLRTAAAVPDEVADMVGLPVEARNLMYPYWCYLGVSTSRVSFSIWASMLQSYLKYGAVIPASRSHGITAALASAIDDAGGCVRYNAEVVGLSRSGRRVKGVILSSGEHIPCSHLIANISPHRLFGSLTGKPPRGALKLANARRQGMSFFVTYLGLDASPEEMGFTDYSWFIAPHMDTGILEAKCFDRHDPDPMLAAVCLNIADPGASPPGTSILSITMGIRPEAWADVAPEEYHDEKMRCAEAVIAQFERATGIRLRGHIEEIETAAPPTFSRYTGSWDGSVYGYEPEPWDGIIPRVVSRRRDEFFTNLRFCGGNAFRAYGYGSSLMSGRQAAGTLLKELR